MHTNPFPNDIPSIPLRSSKRKDQMTNKECFLAYSTENWDLTSRAIKVIKEELTKHTWNVIDWQEEADIANIGNKVAELIRRADATIVDASSKNQNNVAFEVGYAAALGQPVIIIKREGSPGLPEDYGDPEYIDYPAETRDEAGFRHFAARFSQLITRLETGKLSAGHRSLRHSLKQFVFGLQHFLEAYGVDHPNLHLLSGWAEAIAKDLSSGGTTEIRADPDYYVSSFSALRQWDKGRIVAIADLTDQTESFWRPEHPEQMSVNVSERIFLVDWRWFFDDATILANYIDRWRDHLQDHADREYEIRIATKRESAPNTPHPLGPDAVGHHILIMDPDVVGGYLFRRGDSHKRQLFTVRDRLKYESGKHFYDSIRRRAVRFEPSMDFTQLKREWMKSEQIGQWDPAWNNETEYRPPQYFMRYDEHIRAWIPNYARLIRDCAALVEGEIVRVHQDIRTPLRLLELGYGTGALTAQVTNWVKKLNQPFELVGDSEPVAHYLGIDRAEQMHERAIEYSDRRDRNLRISLQCGTALHDLPEDSVFNIVFGSLVLHFIFGPKPSPETLSAFFLRCSDLVADRGSIVVGDVFSSEDEATSSRYMDAWRKWMVDNGLGQEQADIFLAGNPDMVYSTSLSALNSAARDNGFVMAKRKPVGRGDLPFFVVALRKKRKEPTS
jgi:nucleoside 2-deoxyribosyltransferase